VYCLVNVTSGGACLSVDPREILTSPTMKAHVRRIRDLDAVLKDLEPHVKAPDFLRKGRPFGNFGLLPRELLANLLICLAGNFEDPKNRLTVCTDPLGGDGLVFNQNHGGYMSTEHVFVPAPRDGDLQIVENKILAAVAHKNEKGSRYASGKDLVVFSEAKGIWHPNNAARRLIGRHSFENVWVVHLENLNGQEYSYCVVWLEVSRGNAAPAWRIRIANDFKAHSVERIQ